MEFYLAMQNEAINHEKFLKGGMCNIYIYIYTRQFMAPRFRYRYIYIYPN